MKTQNINIYSLIVLILILFLSFSFKIDKVSIVGIWKPINLIYPKNYDNKNDMKWLIDRTFERSKDVFYNFKSNGSFTFDSKIKELQGAGGTYSINGKTLTINYPNIEKSEIIKLTNDELQLRTMAGNMKDFISVYKKVR